MYDVVVFYFVMNTVVQYILLSGCRVIVIRYHMYTLASSPGSTQLFQRFSYATLKSWVEPGIDEAIYTR